MAQLEPYKGTKTRHTCPACGCKNQFTRFIDDGGNYIADDCGICNRSSRCGYRYTAKQFFADNPTVSNFVKARSKRSEQIRFQKTETEKPSFDYIAPEHLKATLSNYDRNAFVQFLFDLFPDCGEEIESVLRMYFVGTYQDYGSDYTCFPQLDRLNRVCKAKLIRFNRATGKRLKGQFDTSSLKAKLKLREDFNYKQIFFGEHLLPKYPNKPVAVVESEKSAIIASLCYPELVWMATGSKQWLKAERLQRLDNRQIILYPDADGFDQWQAVAQDAARQGLRVKVSKLIENLATAAQKSDGFDLADFLIQRQREINRENQSIDSYNSKLEKVLRDESLFEQFNKICDARKVADSDLTRIREIVLEIS